MNHKAILRADGVTAILIVVLCALPLIPAQCIAQNGGNDSPIHWAYASFFGSGRYQFADSPDVRVFRVDVRRRIRQASLENDDRVAGITLRLPVTVGRQDQPFTDIGQLVSTGVDTISFVPGVEFPIPLGEHWTIKPLVNAGYGHAFDTKESAWIYRTGIRSQYTFSGGRFDWSLTNSLAIVGFAGADTPSQQALPLTLGLDARVPLRSRRLGEDPVFLHWHIAHSYYVDEFSLLERDGESLLELDREWEIGVAFSKGDKRLRLKKLAWDRVGLAFRLDSDGDLAGVRLNFRSLFDR